MSDADLVVAEPAPRASFERIRATGRIPFQYCTSCERSVFYPRVLCPHCGSVELEWKTSTGTGEVYSRTHVHGRDGAGYQVLLVDLEEGFRVMGSALGDDPLAIGSRVTGSVAIDPDRPAAEPRFVFAAEVGA